MFTRKKLLWAWALLIVVACTTFVLHFRKEGVPLNYTALETAQKRWAEKSVANYTMQINVDGAHQSKHKVVVREGRVISMETNGKPATPSSWAFWTVEGMFAFLDREIDQASSPKVSYGLPASKRVELKAFFDPKLGYPKNFLRYIQDHPSNIQWEVASFETP